MTVKNVLYSGLLLLPTLARSWEAVVSAGPDEPPPDLPDVDDLSIW